jgi:hydroxymethylglutaryl-CoA synthase
MKPQHEVSIIGYGGYVPIRRIKAKEIARIWGKSDKALPLEEKSVAAYDEDTATMSVEAAYNALKRANIPPNIIGAVYVGTESKIYTVKPTSTVVAEALGIIPNVLASDYEFACKAGTEAMQTCIGLVSSGMVKAALAIGADIARGRPGDELEYTAGAAAAAFILARSKEFQDIAILEGSFSYVTDTPDFWRREGQIYPMHYYRFTGEPAYFHHIKEAALNLMKELGLKPSDFKYAVFHQPNSKFPQEVATALGFKPEQYKPGLLVPVIGNSYAASSMLGLAAVLDIAKPGDRILLASFGSGAGSDAFSFIVEDGIESKRNLAPLIMDYIGKRKYVDYAVYAKHRNKYNK